MTPNDCLQEYFALKFHFSTSYDYFKYNGKVKNKIDFTKRKDKQVWARLSRHRDPRNLMIANLSIKPKMWVGELLSPECEERFRKMMGRWESLPYIFSEDIKKMHGHFNFNFIVEDNQHPHLLKLHFQNKICIETLVILNDLVHYYDYWESKLDDPVWKSMSYIIPKFKPFIHYSKDKMKHIVQERYK